MSAAARVTAFVALLAAIFAAAALAGAAVDPDAGDATHATTDAGHAAGAPAAGLASAQGGYRLVVERTRFAPGRPGTLRFRILDADDAIVRAFDTEQDRRMHLVVVRRDLRRYQHLHPAQDAGGGWTTTLTLPEAGVYRAFADFRSRGERRTLGVDLFAPGRFEPLELPPPSGRASIGGYEIELVERPGEIGFVVRRGGRPVTDLQPYLGARGHLVALREGDLAYSHVHPLAGSPPEIAFGTGASEPGSYRLFVQFRHGGRVRTAAFTREVAR